MRIALLHGYELRGSGSNEYVRYLSRALARAGHEVHVLCREPQPESIVHIGRAYAWEADGSVRELFRRDATTDCVLHRLPDGPVRPVYLTDKQREGNVKSFSELSDEELADYHALYADVVRAVLEAHPVDIVQANHLVWQPSVAAAAGVPFAIYPHGSSIEYTVRADERYHRHAGDALAEAAGVISGNQEVLDRILALFPDRREEIESKSEIVGVGVDTSLFVPVERGARRASITGISGKFGGKRPEQSAELRARLDAGDFAAVGDYLEAYDHSAPDRDVAQDLQAIPWESGRICLFVGALTAGKGVQGLLAAFPRLLPSHLVIVGSGAYREVLEALVHALATGDQDLFDHLSAHGFDLDRSGLSGGWKDVGGPIAATPGLAGHVHFTGRLDHDLLRYLLPCADVAVFPSVVPEAYPLVLMESLSNGVIPAVSDFSGFRDGLNTLQPLLGSDLVDRMRLPIEPETRVEQIATRVASLLADETLDARRKQLRAVAVERFDWAIRAREMVEAYERVLERNASTRS